MVPKLAPEAEESWRTMNGYEPVAKAIRRVRFKDCTEGRGAA